MLLTLIRCVYDPAALCGIHSCLRLAEDVENTWKGRCGRALPLVDSSNWINDELGRTMLPTDNGP